MRQLFFILLLALSSTAYTAKKGFYWSESGGGIGKQVNAVNPIEIKAMHDYIHKCNLERQKFYKEYLENTTLNHDGLVELNNKLRNNMRSIKSTIAALEKTNKILEKGKNKPTRSRITSLQSGIGYQFSKYLAIEVDHLIFLSIAQLNPKDFLFDTKITEAHGLIAIGKASLPVYPKYNIYTPFGVGLVWTHLYNGPDTPSIPMKISVIAGLGAQYELADNITVQGEWMHTKISQIGSFNLFKIGFHFYKN